VQASPQNVVAGQDVVLSGSGFPAGSTLQEQLFSTPVRLGTTRADRAGNFRTTVTIPLSTPPGLHTIRVSVLFGTKVAETTVSVSAPTTTTQFWILTLSRTGADVSGPARLAIGLVAAGFVLVGLAWKGWGQVVPAFSRRRRYPWS
jgi:hypothetical protein